MAALIGEWTNVLEIVSPKLAREFGNVWGQVKAEVEAKHPGAVFSLYKGNLNANWPEPPKAKAEPKKAKAAKADKAAATLADLDADKIAKLQAMAKLMGLID